MNRVGTCVAGATLQCGCDSVNNEATRMYGVQQSASSYI